MCNNNNSICISSLTCTDCLAWVSVPTSYLSGSFVNSAGLPGQCSDCGVCGNGRCELPDGESFGTCNIDCPSTGFCNSSVACGAIGLTSSTGLDGCCPNSLCQGISSTITSFDGDCCNTCGNGSLNPGEQCDPPGSSCSIVGAAVVNGVCNSLCQCGPAQCGDSVLTPPETCDPGAAQGTAGNSCLIGTSCAAAGAASQCTCVPVTSPCPPPGRNQKPARRHRIAPMMLATP
jgi:hypothetical protein